MYDTLGYNQDAQPSDLIFYEDNFIGSPLKSCYKFILLAALAEAPQNTATAFQFLEC